MSWQTILTISLIVVLVLLLLIVLLRSSKKEDTRPTAQENFSIIRQATSTDGDGMSSLCEATGKSLRDGR